MDSRQFLKRFMEEVYRDRWIDDKNKTLFDIYLNDAEYTPVITKIINDIIDSAGYTHQNEYFRIDAIGWISHYEDMKKDAKEEGLKVKAHLWDLKIAVEHENSKADWSDEVMKLIHVKCPLKVIIGYSYSDERGEIERKKLDFVAKWMQDIEALQKGTDEEYLVILGNGCNHKTGISDYDDFGYVGYLYDWETKLFVRINET